MGIFSVYAMAYMHDPCVEKLDGIESGRGESDRLIIKDMRKHTGFNKGSDRESQSLAGERKKILVNFSEYSGVSRGKLWL